MDIEYLEPKIIKFLKQHKIRCNLDVSMFNKLCREIFKIHKHHSITDPLADIPKNVKFEILDFININRFKVELSAILCLDENENIIAIPFAVRDDEYLDAIKKWGKDFIFINEMQGFVKGGFYYYFIKSISWDYPKYTFLGSYHTHPFSAPVFSDGDIRSRQRGKDVVEIIDSAIVGTVMYYGVFDAFDYLKFKNDYDMLFQVFYNSNILTRDKIDRSAPIFSVESFQRMTHEYLKYSTNYKYEYYYYYNAIYWKHLDGTIWKYHRCEIKEIK